MLGPIGSELMSILRILTPDELNRYLDSKEEGKVEAKVAVGGENLSFDHNQSSLGKQSNSNSKKFNKDNQAEIIPIDRYKSKPPEENVVNNEERFENDLKQESHDSQEKPSQSHHRGPASSELESIGVLSASKIKQLESQKLAEELKGRDSTTAFLLKEREKMQVSKKKLMERQAFKLYQSTANQELFEDDEDFGELDEDLSVGLKGILINKKHF